MVIGVLVAVAVPTAFVHAAPETDIGPLAEGPCPIYGVHQMVSQGPAVVKDVNNGAQLFTGGWYKCDCGERFVCEGHPDVGGSIGKYVTEGGIVSWDQYGGPTLFYVNSNMVYYTSSSTLPGYNFQPYPAPPVE